MAGYNYSTIQLQHWRDYKLFVERFSGNWAFRGQADANWVLNNAIERTAFIHFHKGIEAEFVAEFQRGARNYLSKDETPEHLIEWLALMQHHGAPTRLLDLTKSPYIAAYFAIEFCGEREDENIAVWEPILIISRKDLLKFYPKSLAKHYNKARISSMKICLKKYFARTTKNWFSLLSHSG